MRHCGIVRGTVVYFTVVYEDSQNQTRNNEESSGKAMRSDVKALVDGAKLESI